MNKDFLLGMSGWILGSQELSTGEKDSRKFIFLRFPEKLFKIDNTRINISESRN